MSQTGFPENMRRILRFVLQPSMWLITLFALIGFLFGVQSKHPLQMKLAQPSVLENPARPGIRGLSIKPPIFHYDGPVILTLNHGELSEEVSLSIASEDKVLVTTAIETGPPATTQFYFFPGDFSPSTGITLKFFDGDSASLDSLFASATFTFPKVGSWLVPDLSIWASLLAIAVCFGLICSLIWQTPTSVTASYAGTVAMLILACHFGGLALAWRIANQLPAVLSLLIAVFLIRWLALPAKPVVIRS